MPTIREKLDAARVPYDKESKSIALLKSLLNEGNASDSIQRLAGLRTVQRLRTKIKGHVGGSDADQLAHNALIEHETFANHFRHVCTQVADELETIEKFFS